MAPAVAIVAGIAAVVSAGVAIYGAVSSSDQAQSQYNYEQQQAALAEQYRQQQLDALKKYQVTQQQEFSAQQQAEAQNEAFQLGNSRLSLNQQVAEGAYSILGQEGSAATTASTMQASLASSGFKTGGVVAPSAINAAQGGNQVGVIGGKTAGTPKATINIPGEGGTGDETVDIAAQEGQPGGTVGYVGEGSVAGAPNLRTQIYEGNAMKAIQMAQKSLTEGSSLGWSNIGQAGQMFSFNQELNSASFKASQSEQLLQAEAHNQYATAQQSILSEYQTSQLSSGQTSAWVNAFSQIIGAGTQFFGDIWDPTPSSGNAASSQGVWNPYASWSPYTG